MTVAIVAWGIRPPAISLATTTKTAGNSQPDKTPTTKQQTQPSREEFTPYLDRPLRQSLYDPPPPVPEVKQLPPLQVELLGTILEPENSMAIVRSQEGSVQYKRVGETIGPMDSPASVREILTDSIVVEREKERLTLKVRGGEIR